MFRAGNCSKLLGIFTTISFLSNVHSLAKTDVFTTTYKTLSISGSNQSTFLLLRQVILIDLHKQRRQLLFVAPTIHSSHNEDEAFAYIVVARIGKSSQLACLPSYTTDHSSNKNFVNILQLIMGYPQWKSGRQKPSSTVPMSLVQELHFARREKHENYAALRATCRRW